MPSLIESWQTVKVNSQALDIAAQANSSAFRLSDLAGDAFFDALVESVADILGVEYAFLAYLDNSIQHFDVISYAADGLVYKDTSYDPAGAPCTMVYREGFTFFKQDLGSIYPGFSLRQYSDFEGFAGYPLVRGDRIIGHIGVFSRTPLRRKRDIENTLSFFAVRAQAELQQWLTSKRLRLALEAEAHASVAKTMFLAEVTQELEAPLKTIEALSALVKNGGDTAALATEIAETARDMGRIVRDLNSVSTIEMGSGTADRQKFDILAVTCSAIRMAQDQMSHKGIQISVDQPDQRISVLGDMAFTKRTLFCALMSALRRSGQSGIHVTLAAHKYGAAIISLHDSGIALSDAEIEALSDPGSIMDQTYIAHLEGHDLSLPLAQKLIEWQGGAFAFDSTDGDTTITVTFPAEAVSLDQDFI